MVEGARELRRAVPRPPQPPGFVRPRGGLQVADLYAALEAQHPMAVTQDGSIAVYRDGVYHNGESREFSESVRLLLGNDYRPAHVQAVKEFALDHLTASGKKIPGRPGRPAVNFRNGLLDLDTMELRPHTPEYMSLVQLPVDWNPTCECGTYEQWLRDVAGDQAEALEETLAQVLDPQFPPTTAALVFGPPRSGKSTILRIAERLVGEGNRSSVSLHDLARNTFSAAQIYGKVLNVCADLSAEHIQDLSLFKQLLGEDSVTGNKKYGPMFTFRNHALFLFSANEVPPVGEASAAYLQRVRPFSFPNSFAGREDKTLEPTIYASEMPGVARRWVEALRRSRRRGHLIPVNPAVAHEFAVHTDQVRQFLDDTTEPDPDGPGLSPTELYGQLPSHGLPTGYLRWCRDNQRKHPLGQGKFFRRLKEVMSDDRRRASDSIKYPVRWRQRTAPLSGVGTVGTPQHHSPETRSLSSEGSGSDDQDGETPTLPTLAVVAVDLGTKSAGKLHSNGSDFVCLVGTPGETRTDPTMVIDLVRRGVSLAAHDGLSFDFVALARYHGLDYLAAVDDGLLIDTKTLAILADPPQARMRAPSRYYSLDATAARLGLPGKLNDVKALAKQHGGCDTITLDDPSYRACVGGHVPATQGLVEALPLSAYARRELRVMGRLNYAMRVKGWRVDVPLMADRIAQGQRVSDAQLDVLRVHGLPQARADGLPAVKPQATKEGRMAIFSALEAAGVRHSPRTRTGALALSREAWQGYEVPDPARQLLDAVWSINGVRTVYQTVEDNRTGDRVYPTVDAYQASGRLSIRQPGITVMGKRGGRHVEREIFLPEPGHVMVAFDLDQVDARAVAMHCQDPDYMALFQSPDIDAHEEIAFRLWAVRDGKKGERRNAAKAIGHGFNYGEGARTIAAATGLPVDTVHAFAAGMRESFPRLVEWQDEARDKAERGELLDNGYGRLMRPDPQRAYTQGPALMGQGLARDLLTEGLLRLPAEVMPHLRGAVHDELIFSLPADCWQDYRDTILLAMQFEYLGVPVTAGWAGPGETWGEVYA